MSDIAMATGAAEQAPNIIPTLTIDERRQLVAEIKLCLRVFGRRAAREYWIQSPPPHPPSCPNELEDQQSDVSFDCFNHLLEWRVDLDGGRLGAIIADALRRGDPGRRLPRMGIRIDIRHGYVAVANTHPYLKKVFHGTRWSGGWRRDLARMDGSLREKRSASFHNHQCQYVLLPESLFNPESEEALS